MSEYSVTDLGAVTAYAQAVENGYTGTLEQWVSLQVNSANNYNELFNEIYTKNTSAALWEQGGLSPTTGATASSTVRIRTKDFLPDSIAKIVTNVGSYVIVMGYADDGTFHGILKNDYVLDGDNCTLTFTTNLSYAASCITGTVDLRKIKNYFREIWPDNEEFPGLKFKVLGALGELGTTAITPENSGNFMFYENNVGYAVDNDLIGIGSTEPDSERAVMWINNVDSATVQVPEIDDDNVSDVDTWSSQKIDSEIGDLKSAITQRLDLIGSYKNVKIINKSATGTTRFYGYSFVANKTYLVINDTDATATFITRDGNTSDAASIDQPFGQWLLAGAIGEFTASADASYFSTYNHGAGTIVIAEKKDEDPVFDAIENLGQYGLTNARTYYKGTSSASFRYQYNFTLGKTYAVVNRTTANITFQTRLTPDGSTLNDVGTITANQIKTFTATADAKWFNSYSSGRGNILVGEVSETENTVFVKTDDIFNAEPYTGSYDWQAPVVSYGALFKGKANVESFAFFTDPHVMGFGDASRNEEKMQNYFKRVQKAFNATACSFLVCGGDLLNNSTTMDEACYRLGYVKGIFDHLLDKCKLVLGNHDTNYQGKKDSESANNTGRLTNATIASIMYRDTSTKKAYYSFDGSNSKCYVLDTGIEHTTMLAYDWEQVAWLANKLKTDDADHSIIFSHILYSSDSVQTNAATFGSLIEAYNNRTTITLNSVTYDFTGCSGHVEFWVAGHTHNDSNGIINGIPYFITATNSFNSDIPLIDLVLADYENRVLKLVRVGGTGEDRTISLDAT